MSNNETAIILLAGGDGTRIGEDIPKQFIRVAGKPILLHTYERLRNFMPNSLIVIAAPLNYINIVNDIIKPAKKNTIIISGGKTRQDSTYEGLKALINHSPKNVLIHDAARPFINENIIKDVIEALKKYSAVDVAIPTSDTIIQQNEGYIEKIPERKNLLRGQTPQAFRYKNLYKSYSKIKKNKISDFTDDCGIYLYSNKNAKIKIVTGSEDNIKITTPIDLVLADEIFRAQEAIHNFDLGGIDIKDKRILILGGSSGIGKALSQIIEEAGGKCIIASRATGFDICNEDSIKNTLKQSSILMGGIDIVVNSVGVLLKKRLAEQSNQQIDDQVRTNLIGPLLIAKYSYEYLKESKGILMQLASSSYSRGRSNYTVYSSTKASLINMTQGLSEEWADDDIKVKCVIIGRTDTPMRTANFKNENQLSLLNPFDAAIRSLKSLNNNSTLTRLHLES
jgi:2-C-methyl-D-erythritol 4-phosphate cytidylyltransferase